MTQVGNRIFTKIERADKALVERFAKIPTSNINDQMNRLYNTDSTIKPLNKARMAGTAFTVRCNLGDNMMLHRALDLAQPGDVIVVDDGGCTRRSLAGEIMMTYAMKRGIAGVAVNGCLRDYDALSEMEMPIYCKGITPQGPFKFGPGEINVPVVLGGVVVMPGDILIGDPDGIVVIRKGDAADVIEAAEKKLAGETKKLAKYHSEGPDIDVHEPKWREEVLKSGAVVIDDKQKL